MDAEIAPYPAASLAQSLQPFARTRTCQRTSRAPAFENLRIPRTSPCASSRPAHPDSKNQPASPARKNPRMRRAPAFEDHPPAPYGSSSPLSPHIASAFSPMACPRIRKISASPAWKISPAPSSVRASMMLFSSAIALKPSLFPGLPSPAEPGVPVAGASRPTLNANRAPSHAKTSPPCHLRKHPSSECAFPGASNDPRA